MPYIRRTPTGTIQSLHRQPEAQAKLLARKGFRERQSQSSLHLYAPSGANGGI